MTILALAAVADLGAQVGSVRFTIAGGPHAGSYRFQTISMFTPEMQKGGRAEPNSPASFELYTEPGRGKPDGLALRVDFRSSGSRERTLFNVYAIPPELAAPGRKTPLEGRGDVTVRQTEAATTASFRVETRGGVRIEGSLTCPT